MNDITETYKGTVIADWYDRNGHMNVVSYLSIFDQATFLLLEKVGFTEEFIEESSITMVASKLLSSHKKEMFLGDPINVLSGLISFDETFFTVTHRMKRNGVLTASCDIRMYPIHLKTRNRIAIPQSILNLCATFHIQGIKDSFQETL